MINILLHGCKGRMGRVLESLIAASPDMRISAGVDRTIDGTEAYPAFVSLAECNAPVDVVLDFSHFSAVPELLEYCVKNKLPAVIATTSLGDEAEAALRRAAEEIPIFHSFNMSLGINVIANALQYIVPVLEADFDVEIIEKHHNKKVDSPSGTAVMLAEAINESCAAPKEFIYGRHGREDSCHRGQMGIHSVRGGTIPGEHTIIFAGEDEIIEIKHTALSRNIFAKGAIIAAEFINGRNPGLYTMRELVAAGSR